jgi:hypothetical protein
LGKERVLSWDWTNLLSAVVGALVGSVATFFWVRHLQEQTQKNQKQTENNQRRAAGRAVLAEMMTNANSAVRMKGQGLNKAIPDVAWQSELHLIAQLVPLPSLRKIGRAYDSARSIYESIASLTIQQRLDPKWNVAAVMLATEFRDAIEVLYRETLEEEEVSEFLSNFSKLNDGLKEAQEIEYQRK